MGFAILIMIIWFFFCILYNLYRVALADCKLDRGFPQQQCKDMFGNGKCILFMIDAIIYSYLYTVVLADFWVGRIYPPRKCKGMIDNGASTVKRCPDTANSVPLNTNDHSIFKTVTQLS